MRRRRNIRTYLGLAISALCIIVLFRYVDFGLFALELGKADLLIVLLCFGVMSLEYGMRAWRWQFFFARNAPGMSDSYRCLILGFFLNNVLPARMGEFGRAHLGGKATGLSRASVLATVAGERLADGLAISIIFSSFFFLGSTANELEEGRSLLFVAAMFALAAVGTVALLLYRKKIFQVLEKLTSIMPGHLSTYSLSRIRFFIEGLEPMLWPRRALVLSLSSMVIWLVELYCYYLVCSAFDCSLSLSELSLFLAVVNFSSLIPAAPGAIGVIESISTLALEHIGVGREIALAMVVVQHSIQYAVVGIPGLYYFFRMGGVLPVEDDDEVEMGKREKREIRQGAENDENFENLQILRDSPELSVIIPAYNEEERIPATLLKLFDYLNGRRVIFEVIVVDDGSTDDTAKEVLQLSSMYSGLRLLTYPTNRGKGYAVRFGMLNARGDRLIFMDADGSTPCSDMERLALAIDEGADIAIGSRALPSTNTHVDCYLHRKFMGRAYNAVVNLLVLPGVADTQCGFKMFSRKAALSVFPLQVTSNFSFDVEVLLIAKGLGLKMVETPVNFYDRGGSKVSLLRDPILMFLELFKIKWREKRGRYTSSSIIS